MTLDPVLPMREDSTQRGHALIAIDLAIDGMKDRSLIATSEMIDLLLDIRGLIRK